MKPKIKEPLCIGVAAFQGAFSSHIQKIKKLGHSTLEVRTPEDLKKCHGLILPGGESTVIYRFLQRMQMVSAIQEFSIKKPLMGTCAGLILMAKKILDSPSSALREGLGVLNITVQRNAYGRQSESFTGPLFSSIKPLGAPLSGYFIRAPQISALHEPTIKILASHNDRPVLIQQGLHLGVTFHPELTEDDTVHRYFISQVGSSLLD